MRHLRQAAVLLIAAVLPFAVVEAGLRLARWQPTLMWYQAGFDPDERFFHTTDDRVEVAADRVTTFRAEPFPVQRAPGEVRLFAVGDSVTWGHRSNDAPGPLTAYSDVLQQLLRARPGHASDRVVNCGARTFASGRVEHVLGQVLDHRPDAVVASFGSSEFLEVQMRREWQGRESRVPRWFWHLRLVAGLEDLLRRVKGSPATGLTADGLRQRDGTLQAPFMAGGREGITEADRARVLAEAFQRLDRMVAACEAKGVPLVLLTVPSNLRWPPVASLYADAAEREQVEDVVRRSGDLLESGRVEEARLLVQPLVRDKPGIAALHYRLAQVLDRLGDVAAARVEYGKARDTSGFPLRINGSLNDRFRQVSRTHPSVTLVDVERLFESWVADGIPDDRLFLDQNHPTEEAHRRVAEEILRALRPRGIVGPE